MPKTQDTAALTAKFKRSSILAASLFALSGCVSSGTSDVAATIEPLTAAQSAEIADGAEEPATAEDQQVAVVAAAQDGTDNALAAEAGGSAQVPLGDASQLASLTMQNTAVNANNGSIFAVQAADGSAAGTAVTDADGETYTTPAYVPVPGINPAFRSVYQGGNTTVAPEEANAQTGETQVVQESAAAGQQIDPTNSSQQQVAALPQAAETGTDQAVTIAANAADATGENTVTAQSVAETQPEPEKKKKRTLADFFGAKKKETGFDKSRFSEAPAQRTISETAQPVQTASLASDALPGVTAHAMFATDAGPAMESDDGGPIEEDDIDTPVEIAALPGLARLASNGFWMQTAKVDTSCFKPALMRVLGRIEAHYDKKLMVTSGYRQPKSSRKRQSLHTTCSAADIQIAGVSKWELAAFLRTMPGRGGVGTYCHTNSVHIDIGSERDWNWRCRRRK